MELDKFLGKKVNIKDIYGNIIVAVAQDYDDGTEEDEDDYLYLNPYLWLKDIKVIKNVDYRDEPYDIISLKEILSIEEI